MVSMASLCRARGMGEQVRTGTRRSSPPVSYTHLDVYKRQLIYRGKRIVNWCPDCTTAISDDEAEYKDCLLYTSRCV